MSDYVIKPMARNELDQAIAWATEEGWNPGRHDADCFYRADPTGYLMGFLNGEAIASISAVKYGSSFGFIGFYIVKPEFRGQGYGWRLWQAGLASLQGRIIGLDGVVDQQSNYLKSGFKLAYRNIRYQGRGDVSNQGVESTGLVMLSSLPTPVILDYDQALFPADRRVFLQSWLTQPESYGLGLIRHNSCVGYGLLRRCQQGYKIGPLFADTPEFAEILFQGLTAHVPSEQPYYFDVPEVNVAAVALAHRHGLVSMFETARMYMPQAPELPVERIFGVTSFELG